ncbi:MAG TPA: hypothetical protein PKM56_05200, partial [Candidatus Rifleibacterium sp.]|nr:hypothetical protein [Candidatus Rifleibacterium sp.]
RPLLVYSNKKPADEAGFLFTGIQRGLIRPDKVNHKVPALTFFACYCASVEVDDLDKFRGCKP